MPPAHRDPQAHHTSTAGSTRREWRATQLTPAIDLVPIHLSRPAVQPPSCLRLTARVDRRTQRPWDHARPPAAARPRATYRRMRAHTSHSPPPSKRTHTRRSRAGRSPTNAPTTPAQNDGIPKRARTSRSAHRARSSTGSRAGTAPNARAHSATCPSNRSSSDCRSHCSYWAGLQARPSVICR